jgi:dihydrodipicolinate synthase/N-acetylneuraminate lyase
VFDEFRRGNLEAARLAQWNLLPIIEAISVGRFPAGLKEAMRMVGMPVGDVKSPLQHLTEDERKSVAGFLRGTGLLKGGV